MSLKVDHGSFCNINRITLILNKEKSEAIGTSLKNLVETQFSCLYFYS